MLWKQCIIFYSLGEVTEFEQKRVGQLSNAQQILYFDLLSEGMSFPTVTRRTGTVDEP